MSVRGEFQEMLENAKFDGIRDQLRTEAYKEGFDVLCLKWNHHNWFDGNIYILHKFLTVHIYVYSWNW